MSKYVREMVLVPKSEQQQQGGRPVPPTSPPPTQKTPDTTMPPLYWQRQRLLDQLHTAPMVDQAIGLLQDMKDKMGQPTHWPGAGTSEYFRLQNQLQDSLPPPQTYRTRDTPRPPLAKEAKVHTWQPSQTQPVYSAIDDTMDDLKRKYPDRMDEVLIPPKYLTANSVGIAADKGWKSVVSKRDEDDDMTANDNALFEEYKQRMMTMANDYQNKLEELRSSGDDLSDNAKQEKLKDIGLLENNLQDAWISFQDYLRDTRDNITYRKRLKHRLKSPTRQRGNGGTMYKRPRGWLQE